MIKQLVTTAITLAFTPVVMATPSTVQAQTVADEAAKEAVLRSVERGATEFCNLRRSGTSFDVAAEKSGDETVTSLANISGVSEVEAYDFLMGTSGDQNIFVELLYREIYEKCPEELEE